MCTDHSGGVCLSLPLPADLVLDALPDGQFARPLADLCEVGAGEAVGHLGQEVQVHILLRRSQYLDHFQATFIT